MPNVITRGLRRWQLIGIDVLLAIGLLLLAGFATNDPTATLSFTGSPELALLIVTMLAVPVAFRRTWPLPALTITVVALGLASVTGIAWGNGGVAFVLPLAFTLYTVGLLEPRLRALGALVACLAGTAVSSLISAPAALAAQLIVFSWLMLFMTWAAGRATRARRAYAASTAEGLARQAVADERLRIARELHDIVAHSLSLIYFLRLQRFNLQFDSERW